MLGAVVAFIGSHPLVAVVLGLPVGLALALTLDMLLNLPPKGIYSIWTYCPVGLSFDLHFHRRRFLHWLRDNTSDAGGKTWTFRLALLPRIWVTVDPVNVEYILKNNFDNFGKGPRFTRRMQEVLGGGIFNVDGAQWYHQRKTSSHLFRQSNFKNGMLAAFNKAGGDFLNNLENQRKTGKPANISSTFYALTLDVISEVAFGLELRTLRDGTHGFALDFDYVQQYINDLVLKPPGFTFIAKHFTRAGKQYQIALSRLDARIQDVVSKSHQASQESLDEATDLLSMFMARKDPDGKPFTDKFLRDVVVNFMLAGRDTTAAALGWTAWLIAKHPEVQEKCYEEIQRVRKGKTAEDPLTFDELGQLNYIEAAFTEALRLYPSVPKNAKMAFKDDTLPDGTPVKAGDYIVYSPFLMGLKDSEFPEPLRYDPERHLGENATKISAFQLPIFQPGPRVCLGQRFAYSEAKSVLCKLLTAYKIAPAPGQNDGFVHVNFVIRAQEDLHVLLEPREPTVAVAASGLH